MPEDKPIYFCPDLENDILKGDLLYIKFPFLSREYSILKRIPHSPKILDIGCGQGAFMKRAKIIRPGSRIIGLDKFNYLKFVNKEEIEFIESDIEKGAIPLDEATVDFIHCAHVVEHLASPHLLFREIFRLLKKGGMAYVEAPDARNLLIPSLGSSGTLNFYDDPTHIRPFTRESFRRLGLTSGFSKVEAFQVRNWAWFMASPYSLLKFIISGNSSCLHSVLQPIFGLDVACVLYK